MDLSPAAIAVLALVTLERLAELALAKSNTRRLIASGGVEAAPGHYPIIVAFHAVWLAGLWLLAWRTPVDPLWLAAFVLLQALRLWTLATLGRRWTTRIIVVPGERLVRDGPYRFVRHPNYVVVFGEIVVLPFVFGLTAYGLIFGLLNALILAWRIRAEERALAAAVSTRTQGVAISS